MTCPVLIITKHVNGGDFASSSVVHIFPDDRAVDLAIASAEKTEKEIRDQQWSQRIELIFVRLYDQDQQRKIDATMAANQIVE
jgi:hypothetical protein